MTDYCILAVSEDTFTNDKNEKFECRYIVAKRSDNVKPLVFKCTKEAYNDAKRYINKHCNAAFDEKGRINGLMLVSE